MPLSDLLIRVLLYHSKILQAPFLKMSQLIFRMILFFSTPRRELESVFLAFKTMLTGLMSSFERSIKLRKRFPTRFRMKESVREKVAFRRELGHFSRNGGRSSLRRRRYDL